MHRSWIVRPSVERPQLTLAGAVMRDQYQVASLTLAFARGSALDRERCWALALGAATLVTCTEAGATLQLERSEEGTFRVRMRLDGAWSADSETTRDQTIARLRELGFRSQEAESLIALER